MCLLLLLASCGVPCTAWATCWFKSGSATTVTFNAGTITLKPNEQPSTTTPIWTSPPAPANPPTLSCDGNTPSGIVNTIGGPPSGGDDTLFPTGVPGISYRITYTDVKLPGYNVKLPVYPDYTMPSGTYNLGGTSTLELFYTGPYLPPNISTLTDQLSQWKIDICDNPDIPGHSNNYKGCNGTVAPRPVGTFKISGTIKIQVTTCDIDAGSVNKSVPLPVVSTAQLAANKTSGKTEFSLQLIHCPVGQKVYINLKPTTDSYTGANGVIANTATGNPASGVGVQILKADGTTPVTFGDTQAEAIFTGTTTTSSYPIKLYAQYYRTGTPVSAGLVKGDATYTLNYQ